MDSPDGRTVDMIRLNADYSIDVQVVLGDSASAQADAQNAVAALRDRLDRQVDVRLTVADTLPYTGGKIKYITSDVLAPI